MKDVSKECLQASFNWKSLFETHNPSNLTDPYICNQISRSCCYISIKYSFNTVPIEQTYCFPLTGNSPDWIRMLKNQYSDELMYYANMTNDFYYLYKSIGGNLVFSYYQNYSCMDLHPLNDYSNYAFLNCAAFDQNGTCRVQKDEDYFNQFTQMLYQNVSDSYCNNYDVNGNCIDYKKDPTSDPTALQPLLDVLKQDLAVEEDIQQNQKLLNQNKTGYNWPTPCKPIPQVKIEIICPPEYTAVSGFIELWKAFLFIQLIILLI